MFLHIKSREKKLRVRKIYEGEIIEKNKIIHAILCVKNPNLYHVARNSNCLNHIGT